MHSKAPILLCALLACAGGAAVLVMSSRPEHDSTSNAPAVTRDEAAPSLERSPGRDAVEDPGAERSLVEPATAPSPPAVSPGAPPETVLAREVRGDDPESQVISEGPLVNGKREGDWISISPEGTIWSRCTYKNGLLDGHSILWDSEGRLQTDTQYKGGKPDGLAIGWHSNGNKAFEINWVAGVENGPWKQWYDTGQPKDEGTMKAGQPDGKYVFYRADGSIDASRSGVYSNGKKIAELP